MSFYSKRLSIGYPRVKNKMRIRTRTRTQKSFLNPNPLDSKSTNIRSEPAPLPSPSKRIWSACTRRSLTHHSNLLGSPAIYDDLYFHPWQHAAPLMNIQSTNEGPSVEHVYHDIGDTRQCDSYWGHPRTMLMCITISLFALRSCTRHRVMEGKVL